MSHLSLSVISQNIPRKIFSTQANRKEAKKQTEEPEKNDEMEEKLRTLEVEFFELTRKTDEDEDGDLLSSIETGDGDE